MHEDHLFAFNAPKSKQISCIHDKSWILSKYLLLNIPNKYAPRMLSYYSSCNALERQLIPKHFLRTTSPICWNDSASI